MTHTVVGLFDNRTEAQAAMQELVAHGFIQEDIDLSNRRMDETGNTSAYAGTNDADSGYTDRRTDDTSTGIGDSISNFFSSLFGDDRDTASSYTNAAHDADAILSVQVDSEERAREASEIFDRHGAIDVDERNAQYSSQDNQYDSESNVRDFGGAAGAGTMTGTNTPVGGMNTTDTTGDMRTANTLNAVDRVDAGSIEADRRRTDLQDEAVIPVVEEDLQVGKREIERGGARVRSRVVERPVEAHVRLREEHVVVNRRPVNRAVTDADLNNFKEGDIELTEHAEVPIVGKQARVVEEVEIGKTVEEHDETVRDSVRRSEVDVEEFDRDDTTHTGTRRANS